jgi:apolipoprotein N-acyltransferase
MLRCLSPRQRLETDLLSDAHPGIRALLLIAGAGAVALPLARPFGPWTLLAWVSLVPLLFLIVWSGTIRRAFGCGWLFGTLVAALAIGWLAPALQRFGDFPATISWALFALVAAHTGLTLGLFAALLFLARRRWPDWPLSLLAPVMLTSAEFASPRMFDWNIGVSQAGHPWITQVADVTGVIGLSFLIAMVGGAIFDIVAARLQRNALPWRSVAGSAILLAAALAYSQFRIADIDARRALAPALRIGAVQANMSGGLSSDPQDASRRLLLYLHKSRQLVRRGAELILWPETAFPYTWRSTGEVGPEELRQAALLKAIMGELGVPLLTGMVHWDSASDGRYHNSAHVITADGRIQGRYDKQLLFPLGEYMPLAATFPFLDAWSPVMPYTPGTQRTTLPLRQHRIATLICYEDLKPEFVREIVTLRPNLLVSLSSLVWFDAEVAPAQHLAVALFRSIELRLDMVRVSTTGISAIVDAAGRVTVQTRPVDPKAQPGVQPFGLTGTVAMLDEPDSIYARYGPVFAWLNLLAAFGLLALPRRARDAM